MGGRELNESSTARPKSSLNIDKDNYIVSLMGIEI